MALMTDERRKEMEEEMSRFELEILGPEEEKGNRSSALKAKPLVPPPPPPNVATRMPEVAVLAKGPPPPPPHSPPVQTILRPPPPPPPTMQFIPHQLHRQPPRPPMRPNFMGGPMRGPPQHFNNFGPPMGHHHHMRPMHPMMNMGNSLPMPPGFCPPMGGGHHYEQFQQECPPSEEPQEETPAVVESAPTVYAAPFVKNPNEQQQQMEVAAAAMAKAAERTQPPAFTKREPVGPVFPPEDAVVSKKREKKKKIVRMAGGQAWEDNSLLDWDTDDFRIFCGDLGNDVTDEVLIRAFSKYTSFVKAKVIRDKRTNKTKGFGFVSFKDPQDFIKAMREMNGRYVGSRPIKLRKSTWRDRNMDIVKKKQREKEKLGLL